MLITDIVRAVEHIDVFSDITDFMGEETTPDEIYYEENRITVGGFIMRVENARLAFAQALNCFDEPLMSMWSDGNVFCENTKFNGPLELGYHNTIGKAGFGFERDKNGLPLRIKHLGNVSLGEKVSIGSNVCIDRGTVGATVIGNYTKIDNLVHIAHNVQIGNGCLIVAGTVIGGSAKIGDNTFIGINASIKNGIRLGKNVTIGMGAIVLGDVPDNTTVKGTWKN